MKLFTCELPSNDIGCLVGVQGSLFLLLFMLNSIGSDEMIGHKLWLPNYVKLWGLGEGFPNFKAMEISGAILENPVLSHLKLILEWKLLLVVAEQVTEVKGGAEAV